MMNYKIELRNFMIEPSHFKSWQEFTKIHVDKNQRQNRSRFKLFSSSVDACVWIRLLTDIFISYSGS